MNCETRLYGSDLPYRIGSCSYSCAATGCENAARRNATRHQLPAIELFMSTPESIPSQQLSTANGPLTDSSRCRALGQFASVLIVPRDQIILQPQQFIEGPHRSHFGLAVEFQAEDRV